MSESYFTTTRVTKHAAPWTGAPSDDPFSTEEFAMIASGYQHYTGRPAWVGYGFTAPGADDLARVFLLSEDSPADRFILTQPSPGFYEVLAPDGDLLWSGSGLDNLLEALAPATSESLP